MSSSIDPYAELASLFLTDEPVAAPTFPARAGRSPVEAETVRSASVRYAEDDDDDLRPLHRAGAPVEIALVGHLPVMSGLWLSQYADQVARREGPTALVRLERGQVTLELLRAPNHRGLLERAMGLEQALGELLVAAKRWIVCPGSESALDGPFPGDALSLLTGADDAATVGAYRMMKNLAERWHAAHWSVPPIGLVVFGASPERVDEIAEKLDRTTKAFLDVDLAVTGQQQRMDAIESVSRRTFAGVELTVRDVVDRIRQPNLPHTKPTAVQPDAAVPGEEPAPTTRRDPLGATMNKLAPKPQSVRPLGRPIHDMGEASQRVVASRTTPELSVAEGPRLVHGSASVEVEPLPARQTPLRATSNDPALASTPTLTYIAPPPPESGRTDEREAAAALRTAPRVDDRAELASADVRTAGASSALAALLPGLSVLPLKAPNHPEVELARDERGRLHLVVADRQLAALRPAEAWAYAHIDLLRVAFPELAVTEEPIVRDVVTHDAPSIIPLHGTGLRLHLLVSGAGETLHVHLNR